MEYPLVYKKEQKGLCSTSPIGQCTIPAACWTIGPATVLLGVQQCLSALPGQIGLKMEILHNPFNSIICDATNWLFYKYFFPRTVHW